MGSKNQIKSIEELKAGQTICELCVSVVTDNSPDWKDEYGVTGGVLIPHFRTFNVLKKGVYNTRYRGFIPAIEKTDKKYAFVQAENSTFWLQMYGGDRTDSARDAVKAGCTSMRALFTSRKAAEAYFKAFMQARQDIVFKRNFTPSYSFNPLHANHRPAARIARVKRALNHQHRMLHDFTYIDLTEVEYQKHHWEQDYANRFFNDEGLL